MKNRTLQYRFHDPNPAGVFADSVWKVFLEINLKLVEQAMRNAATRPQADAPDKQSLS